MAGHSGSLRVIVAAIAGNVAIAVCKFGAAIFTGSAAMYSEAIHSSVDIGNELLLLLGMRRAGRPADAEHPFGYGLQLYFWVFVVAVMIFGLGALVAFYEGIEKMLRPTPATHVVVNYIVLGTSLVFESCSWLVASREFRQQRGRRGWLEAVRRSKDPTVFTVLFEDTAALIGLVIALAGISLAEILDMPRLDGAASLGIGLVLAGTAAFLAYESQSLLTGEAVQPEVRAEIERIAQSTPGVVGTNHVLTMHFGPQEVLAALSLDFDDARSAGDVEAAVSRIEREIKAAYPEVTRVFVEVKDRGIQTRTNAAQV
ncbi:MAG: cation transporter [Alphaproteobacteria bacterium]|nr:cation transporter [Alphaproteobacteria bacterium]